MGLNQYFIVALNFNAMGALFLSVFCPRADYSDGKIVLIALKNTKENKDCLNDSLS